MKTLLVLLFLCSAARADTAPVTLAWDKNAEADVERYELQIGTGPGVYDRTFQVTDGAVQQAVTLETGVLYYAVVSAINTSGIRSLPSKQLIFQVYKPGEGKPPAAPKGLRVAGAVNVALEQSDDLRNWLPIYTAQIAMAGPAGFWRVRVF